MSVMKEKHTHQLGLRLGPELMKLVDQVASIHHCDRSEAMRHIIGVGAPQIIEGRSVNINRLLVGMEILVIDCLRKAQEVDPEKVDVLVKAAYANMEAYHA
jgi:hypothetical protein